MKRVAWTALLLVLALTSMGSKRVGIQLSRLTIINKTGEELFIRLDNNSLCYEDRIIYNLTIPIGTKESPTEKTFTIEKDYYTMQIQYVKEWDPVYTYSVCTSGISVSELNAYRNNRFTFTPCTQRPPRFGEISQEKFWQGILLNQENLLRMFKASQKALEAQKYSGN